VYTARFIKLEKQALRALTDKSLKKAIKSKKGHSLVAGEKLMTQLAKASSQTKISFFVSDAESGKQYLCEDIALAGTAPVSIMDILQQEIFSSLDEFEAQEDANDGAEEAEILFARLCAQYRNERSAVEQGDAAPPLVSASDFAELDQASMRPENQDLAPTRSLDFLREPEVEHGTLSPALPEEVPPAPDIIEEEASAVESPSSYPPQTRHEAITFPTYDEYVDLPGQSETIRQYIERLEKGNLLNFLGLEQGAEQCSVDGKKYAYAGKELNNPVFEHLRDKFHRDAASIRDRAKAILSELHDRAVDMDYEAVAGGEVAAELAEIEHGQAEELDGFVAEEDRIYDSRAEVFEKEQVNALEIFKRQQEVEKDVFVQSLEEKRAERITQFKRDLSAEFAAEKAIIIDKAIYDLKHAQRNILSEDRWRTLRELDQGLIAAAEESWAEVMKELSRLQEKLEAKTQEFKDDVAAELAEARAVRDEERRNTELELAKERQCLEQEQAQAVREAAEREKSAVERVEELVTGFEHRWTGQASADKAEMKAVEHRLLGKVKTALLILLPILAVVLTLVLTPIFLDTPENDLLLERLDSVEQQLEQGATRETELLETIQNLEQQLEEALYEPETPETLEDLLAAGLYSEAAQRYNDWQSLNKIGTAIYEAGILSELVLFNRIYRTMFGVFDEALLWRDFETAYSLFREMDGETLAELTRSGGRLNDFVIMLYQNGHADTANGLLAGNKE